MAQPVIDIKKVLSVSDVLHAHPKEQVGIDLGGNHLKFARVIIHANKRELVNIAHRDVTGLSEEDISKAVKTTIEDMKANEPEVVVTIPAHLVITKNIEIPSTDPREIMAIVNLQASRHTPYSREEIIVDYIHVGTYKQTYSRILLLIASREVIKRQFLIVEKAGFKCAGVLFAPVAIAAAMDKFLKLSSHDVPIGSLHVDENSTDFMIIFKDKPVFIRSIPVGTQHFFEEKERYHLRFVDEVRGSLEAYESESIGKTPHMLVLTGAVEATEGLDTMLAETARVPVHAVPYCRAAIFPDEIAQKIASVRHLSFLNVIASTTAVPPPKVSLIPEEIRMRKNIEERGRELIKTGIFILSIALVLSMIFISKIYIKSLFLQNLKTKYAAIGEEAAKLEKSFGRATTVANYLSTRGYSLEVLADLATLAPYDLALADIRYDAQGKFSLGGTADSMSVVFAFVDKLEKSSYFKDVKTKYTTKRKAGKRDLVDFEIVATLEKKLSG